MRKKNFSLLNESGIARSQKPGRVKAKAARPSVFKYDTEFRKTVLPNGIKVVTERHPHSRAASVGVWINKGTRDETSNEAGLAHFLEHMVFKRTKRRSAYQIARAMEEVGGELNAFTSREYTCFVTHSLREHLGLSLDVLADLVCNPSFDPTDIRKEKQVVIQEINMAEDQLEDCIFDKYLERAYADSTLGCSILGSVKSIEDMKRSQLIEFHRRQYTPSNIIVSAAGNIEHDEVLGLVLKHLKFPKSTQASEKKPKASKSAKAKKALNNFEPKIHAFRDVVRRPSEQVHILMGLPSADFRDPLRFDSYIVNALLGGGMTSRLYQSVREDRGLVYSIFSQLSTFVDSGQVMVYAGTEPKHAPTVIELIFKEFKRLRKNGISRADLNLFKTQVTGSILLGADDVESRMNSLGINEMIFGRYRSVDDVMKEVESVTLDSVHEYIEKYINEENLGLLVMGAMPEEPTRKWLNQL